MPTNDITFCDSDCTRKKCFRHKSNIIQNEITMIFGTWQCDYSKSCEDYKPKKGAKHNES